MSKPIYDFDTMKCTGCGSDWITQRQTIAYGRTEDADFSARVSVSKCGDLHAEYVPSDENPSARRHSAMLIFDCENCSVKSVMFFIQHKGQTFTKWETVK